MKSLKAPLEFIKQQNLATEIKALAGTVICHSGDQCQHLIVLLEGQVCVYRPSEDGRRITLYHVKAGESCILTASCILNGAPFPAIAEVEEDAVGLAIPASTVNSWMQEHNVWQAYMFSLLSQRMGDLIILVDALAFRNLDMRLANWLLERTQTQQEIITTHQLIAEDLASSREVISRLLKEFEREGLIKLSRGKVSVLKTETFKKITLM